MTRSFRPAVTSPVRLLVLTLLAAAFALTQAQLPARAAGSPPPQPLGLEAGANANGTISLDWAPTPGATSYRLYRGTAAGGEGSTPIATLTSPEYTDTNVSQHADLLLRGHRGQRERRVAAFRRGRLEDSAADRHRRHHARRGVGQLPGLLRQGLAARRVRLVPDADRLVPPGARLVRREHADPTPSSTWPTPRRARMTFNNVVVPTSGLYTLDWRYAFAERACSPASTTGRWAWQ